MSTKKRVSKKQGFRFTLLHRSQQDPLYHDEEHGSKFILHPADRKTAEAMEKGSLQQEGAFSYVSGAGASGGKATSSSGPSKKRKQEMGALREVREVDEYGLPLDGYDYSKHMSSLGGGAFISAEGIRIENVLPAVEKVVEEEDVLQLIPESAFASASEQPRLLEAITLRPEGMDEDMKRQLGLADDGDDDQFSDHASTATGEWGDLQDDFMAQIIAGGAAPAEGEEEDQEDQPKNTTEAAQDGDGFFDFDAHMQRLMKEAEEEDENDDEDEEEDEYDAFARRKRGGAAPLSTTVGVDRAARDVDAHFDAVLAAEYENDDDDDEEEEFEDEMEFDDGENEEEEEIDSEPIAEEEEEEGDMGDDDAYDEEFDDDAANFVEDKVPQEKQEKNSRFEMESQSTARRSQKPRPKRIEQDDPIFLQAINEFLERKASDASLGEVAHPPPAAETLRLVGKQALSGEVKEHPETGEPSVEGARQVGELEEEEEEDEEEEFEDEEPPTYEEMMELWGTYKVTPKPMFDCETIVSTRSTTDNIPSQIFIAKKPSKKNNGARLTSEAPVQQIVEGDEDGEDDTETVESVARDVARLTLQSLTERSKNETPAERKARKAQLKELQRDRRAQKKQTKEAFRKERVQIVNAMTAPGAPKPGVTEFKI